MKNEKAIERALLAPHVNRSAPNLADHSGYPLPSYATKRFALLLCLLLTSCSNPTPLEKWQAKMHYKCMAMGGNDFLDGEKFECYRHPIARMTKQLFTAEFGK